MVAGETFMGLIKETMVEVLGHQTEVEGMEALWGDPILGHIAVAVNHVEVRILSRSVKLERFASDVTSPYTVCHCCGQISDCEGRELGLAPENHRVATQTDAARVQVMDCCEEGSGTAEDGSTLEDGGVRKYLLHSLDSPKP
eukprot:Lithocolla_globosa_v1_NODE_5815_length_1179_cov_128.396797.p3 type:complete len:142 gc:universal NODE_5815_length_1179_cov_128.396797:183-608(+)